MKETRNGPRIILPNEDSGSSALGGVQDSPGEEVTGEQRLRPDRDRVLRCPKFEDDEGEVDIGRQAPDSQGGPANNDPSSNTGERGPGGDQDRLADNAIEMVAAMADHATTAIVVLATVVLAFDTNDDIEMARAVGEARDFLVEVMKDGTD